MKFHVTTHYEGREYPDCITLVPGDVIEEAVELDDYWVQGTNQRTGQTGILPRFCAVQDKTDVSDITISCMEKNGKEQTPSPDILETKKAIKFPKVTIDRLKSNESLFGAYSPKILYASTDKLFKSDRGEYRGAKAVAGLTASLIIGVILFLLFVFSFDYSLTEATITTTILTVILAICLGASSLCRCAISLIFPNFFTGKGRAVLLSIIFGIMLTGPITNITDNAKETGRSLACLTELATKQAKAVQQHLAVPIKDLTSYVENQKSHLDESLRGFRGVTSFLDEHLKVLFNTADEANNAVDEVVKKCSNPIEDVVKACRDACTVDVFGLGCNTACDEIATVKSGCDEIKTAIGASGVQTAINMTKSHLKEIREYYAVDIEITTEFNAGANTSKSLNATQVEINEDIESKAKGVKTVLGILKKALSLSIAFLFLQSFWYLRNYLSKDAYDNIYITKQFVELDKQSKTTLLPLKKKEEDKYVMMSSWKLVGEELAHCKFGLIQVLLHFLICFLIVIFDWSQYYILFTIGQYGDVNITAEGNTQFNIDINGKGPIADMYRIMLDSVKIDSNFNVTFNIQTCLPNPHTPNVSVIPLFFFLYLCALVFVFLRGYGMRLRAKIAGYFYPEQERERLEYLHKKIRHKRVGFLKFLRQHIKSTNKEAEVKDKLRFSTWLMFNFPIFEKCIKTDAKMECTSCEQQENSFNHITLTQCRGTTGGVPCDAWYCEECITALDSVCPLCSTSDVVLRE